MEGFYFLDQGTFDYVFRKYKISMFIHRALNSIPSKPVMFLAPLLIVLVLISYYWNVKSDCQDQVELRDKFVVSVANAGETGQPLRLDELYSANWEFAKTFQDFQPKHRKQSLAFLPSHLD
jgi:hypothetical protein